jgi:hypothetical protein
MGIDQASARREGRLRLGFLANVPFTSEPGGARRGLAEAIATLFGALDREYRDETQHRIQVFRDAIAGKPVEFRSPELIKGEPPQLIVRPNAAATI